MSIKINSTTQTLTYKDTVYQISTSKNGLGEKENSFKTPRGKFRICEKIGEEAVETVIAGVAEGKKEVVGESVDLMFHLMILWAERGVETKDIEKEIIQDTQAH